MLKKARSAIPWWLALVAGVAAGAVAWLLVRDEVVAKQAIGQGGSRELFFVAFFAGLAFFATLFVARRFIEGPALGREDFSFSFTGDPTASLGELDARLQRAGYRLRWLENAAAGEPPAAAPPPAATPAQPLATAKVRVEETTDRTRGAHLVLSVARPRSDGDGLGFIEVHDGPSGLYRELVLFLIVALAELLPGLQYKRLDSSLGAEDTTLLAASLPSRPRRLRR